MTETAVVNRALRRAGEARISAMTDAVPGAASARDIYDYERDSLLRSHPWNFATARYKLNRLADTPVFEFEYAYSLPSDFLRMVAVYDNDAGDGTVRYKMESLQASGGDWHRVLLCDAEDVYVRYVRKVTDTSLFDPLFADCLVLKLASIFATDLTNSNTLMQLFEQKLRDVRSEARSTDGIEDMMDRRPMGSWAASRHGWSE